MLHGTRQENSLTVLKTYRDQRNAAVIMSSRWHIGTGTSGRCWRWLIPLAC